MRHVTDETHNRHNNVVKIHTKNKYKFSILNGRVLHVKTYILIMKIVLNVEKWACILAELVQVHQQVSRYFVVSFFYCLYFLLLEANTEAKRTLFRKQLYTS